MCLLADLDFSLSDEHTVMPSIRRAGLHQIPRCHHTQSVRSVLYEQVTSKEALLSRGGGGGVGSP